MIFFNLGSISRKLTLLVILSVMPALIILFYSGMEQRRKSIEQARHELQLLTNTMAEAQVDVANSVKQVLATLSLLPEVQNFKFDECSEIFKAVLSRNPDYLNIALTDLNGDVIVSGKPSKGTNLSDRKHFQGAIKSRDFAVGEYIVSRIGTTLPAFAFAYPVLDKNNKPVGVLTTAIKLDRFSRFHSVSSLPENSFIAVTDHNGIRLFYFPPKNRTNPIGKPIRKSIWDMAEKASTPGISSGPGSDGVERIIAFEQVSLTTGDSPYLYVWAGISEDNILKPANAAMVRNLMLMFLASLMALFIAWVISKKTLLTPIKNLVATTSKFSQGDLQARCDNAYKTDELGVLSRSFNDMADTLASSHKTLQENEARFRLVMDSLGSLVYVADMETYEILFINKVGVRMFGDITGKVCWQTIQKGQSGPCPFCTNKYLLDKNGKPADVYNWEFQNTENEKWFHIHDKAIRWVDDRIVRLEVATDITKRKHIEAKLSEETERLAVTLRSIGDGVITTDTEGRVVLINKVAETLTGWDSQDAIGKPLSEVFRIINGKTREPYDNTIEDILSSKEYFKLDENTVLISKNKLERYIADSGAPIRDKDGNVIGVVLVFRDITQQLRTEQELLKVAKLESIGILAGGIAHDFNNILAAILGNIDLALVDSTLSPKTQNLLSEVYKASLRARELTQQLLTFAKGGEPIKEVAPLTEVVRDSATFVLRGGKVSCTYTFPEDLWFVDIDKGQISQVVQNIILNASNAMPDGGTIEVSCENICSTELSETGLPQSGNYVKMSIQDHGEGIPEDVLNKVFDPYFSTKEQGNGLGLAITHSIISKHGGSISVESTVGAGTTFTIFLPASHQDHIWVTEEEEALLNLQHSRAMVLDDDEQVLEITKVMLEHIGFDVEIVRDGEHAIQLYKEAMNNDASFDLVIMDLTIPGGMGGKDAVKGILALNQEAKVIVASGYSNDPVMANFKQYGFSSAIVKPYQLVELRRIAGQLLS